MSRNPTHNTPTETVTAHAATHVSEATISVKGTSMTDMLNDEYFGPVVDVLHGKRDAIAAVVERAKHFCLLNDALFVRDTDSTGCERLRRCVAGQSAQLLLLRSYHDSPTGGHQGAERTLLALSEHFFWPRMRAAVTRYVKACDSCQLTKGTTTSAPVQPIQTPPAPGHTLSLDFTEVPCSVRGNDYLLTLVDKFSKMIKVFPTTKAITAEQAAELTLALSLNTFARVPEVLISDRDPRFTAAIWQRVWTLLNVQCKMTTAHRPQADGQTERAHRQVLEYLRHYCNEAGSDWDDPTKLAQLEFALNSKVSASTGTTAFQLHLGRAAVPPAAMGTPTAATAPPPRPFFSQTAKWSRGGGGQHTHRTNTLLRLTPSGQRLRRPCNVPTSAWSLQTAPNHNAYFSSVATRSSCTHATTNSFVLTSSRRLTSAHFWLRRYCPT